MQPLVSILIPVYNCRQWVTRAIESALAQTWSNKEIIILDDGSTDGSKDILQRFSHEVRIESVANAGQNVSRNYLTRLSSGEWLVYLDADDELSPESVSQKMELRDSAEAIYGTMEWATFHGTEKTESWIMTAEDFPDPLVAAFSWRFPNTSSFLFSRAALLAAGGWNENVKNCTDYALYFNMILNGARFRAAPAAASLYRNWSPSQATNEDPIRKIRTRLEVMWSAAERLYAKGGWTFERKEAFQNAALSVIRLLSIRDMELAKKEHQRLVSDDPDFRPSHTAFPSHYVTVYNMLGFWVAERFATLVRPLRSAAAQTGARVWPARDFR